MWACEALTGRKIQRQEEWQQAGRAFSNWPHMCLAQGQTPVNHCPGGRNLENQLGGGECLLKAHTLIDYCVDTALPSFPPSVSPVKERAVIIPDQGHVASCVCVVRIQGAVQNLCRMSEWMCCVLSPPRLVPPALWEPLTMSLTQEALLRGKGDPWELERDLGQTRPSSPPAFQLSGCARGAASPRACGERAGASQEALGPALPRAQVCPSGVSRSGWGVTC